MAKITLRASFHQERNQWIGWCPDLDVTSQGATRDEAEGNLREAVELFLETCQEMGTVEEVLREAGLLPIPEVTTFQVPWPRLKDSRSDTSAATPSSLSQGGSPSVRESGPLAQPPSNDRASTPIPNPK